MALKQNVDANIFEGLVLRFVHFVNLGHVIKNDRSDTLVESVLRDFNITFNSFMADFGCTSSVVKNKLFQQYCMVFYGFQNCALYNKDIDRLYVPSRKALWILWSLAFLTHSALLPHIIGIQLHDVGIRKKILKHVHTGFNHDSSLLLSGIWYLMFWKNYLF